MQWGDRWLSRGKPPVTVTDSGGRALDPVVLRAGKQPVGVRDLHFRPDVGASARTREFLVRTAKQRGTK
jgi:hypothetical protein